MSLSHLARLRQLPQCHPQIIVSNDTVFINYTQEDFAFESYWAILDLNGGNLIASVFLDCFLDSFGTKIESISPDLSLVNFPVLAVSVPAPLIHSESIVRSSTFLDAEHDDIAARLLLENAQTDASTFQKMNDSRQIATSRLSICTT